jgi:hypothetical protein
MATINNAVFAYTKIQAADFKYGSSIEKEFSVDCIVDKTTAKAWNKEFQKQKAKVVDREDFERIYKITPPFEGDELYVIKLKKPAQYKDGTPIPDATRPRVFEKNAEGKLIDITKDKLVSNGSKGAVSYDIKTNDFGTFASLKAIRVDDLIEYKKAGGAPSFDELGDVESLATDFDDVPDREMSDVQKSQRQVPTEPSVDADVEDDGFPF